jgi:hypothetical protein
LDAQGFYNDLLTDHNVPIGNSDMVKELLPVEFVLCTQTHDALIPHELSNPLEKVIRIVFGLDG